MLYPTPLPTVRTRRYDPAPQGTAGAYDAGFWAGIVTAATVVGAIGLFSTGCLAGFALALLF
jgi:hypothetical protein